MSAHGGSTPHGQQMEMEALRRDRLNGKCEERTKGEEVEDVS